MTGDETWLYFFEPDNKLNNKMWVVENNERPVVARRSRSVRTPCSLTGMELWLVFLCQKTVM